MGKKPLKEPEIEVLPPEKNYRYTENIDENSLVVKSNKLLEARYKLSLQEKRIIVYMVAMINKDDEDFYPYKFNIRKLAEIIGIQTDGFYNRLKLVTKQLVDNVKMQIV
jgi:hypothetical protein